MSSARRRDDEDRRNYLAAIALIVGVLVISYIAFGHPTIGGTYKLNAVVSSSNQLRSGSPVRIAGVDVGQVTAVHRGPGHTSKITMRINDEGRPLHKDASLKIRPRLFLEGGFYVDLKAGSPSAPALDSGATLPLPQTAVPVQLNDLLSSLDLPARNSFTDSTKELHTALSGGGAHSLRRTARQLEPTLRDLAWVAKAAQGRRPHDVSELVSNGAKVSAALASRDADLTGLVVNLDRSAQALNAGDGALGRSVESLDRLLRVAPPALDGVDATLPALTRFARAIRPGLHGAPAQLRQINSAVRELATLVSPAERERVLSALSTTFQDLPGLVNRLASLFPVTGPLTECLGSHVVPMLTAKIPDGKLSTGQPVWQEFAHALVGFSGISQNFDANGYNVRYEAALSPAGLSVETVPGLGQIVSNAPPILQSRPVWMGNGSAPAYRPDAPCADQPLPTLDSATRTVRMRHVPAEQTRVSLSGLRQMLRTGPLRKALGVTP